MRRRMAEKETREKVAFFLWMHSDQSEVMMVPAGDSGRKRPFNIVYIYFFLNIHIVISNLMSDIL